MEITGLTAEEINEKKKLGLSNTQIDSYSPSHLRIFFNNIFTVLNVALSPLLITLLSLGVFEEVISLSAFLILNTIINTVDEIRVKHKLQKLKKEFQAVTTVIRNGVEVTLESSEIVQGDFIIAKEGESIITDGKVIRSNYLQIDESALTGESNYIEKEENDTVYSGSYVVTGDVIYVAEKVGGDNYLNELGARSSKYKEKKSRLEAYSQKLILMFTGIGIGLSVIHFIALQFFSDTSFADILLSITTIISVAIPQSILAIIILTYVISVAKLGKQGILVQKRGAIDDLSGVDTICLDKTGTITTNEMHIASALYNSIEKEDLELLFSKADGKLYGVNRTLQTLLDYYVIEGTDSDVDDVSFDQIPFTSKNKFSAFQVDNKTLVMGIPLQIKKFIQSKYHKDIDTKIKQLQEAHQRVLLGVLFKKEVISDIKADKQLEYSSEFFIIGIAEGLNPGIETVINDLMGQGISLKVISGDSERYVSRIAKKVNLLKNDTQSIDMSMLKNKSDAMYDELIKTKIVFARSSPDDKEQIIRAFQRSNKKVAMIGDGVNDVLGLKQADVGVSMESGSKVAREVSDIVLLKNDYFKIPTIFFEGNNIIYNLKFATKVFFARTIMIVVLSLFFTFFVLQDVPLLPTSGLIFTFIGSSSIGYILTFTRQNVTDQDSDIASSLRISLPYGLLMGLSTTILYVVLRGYDLTKLEMNTALTIALTGLALMYSIYLLIKAGKFPRNTFLIIGGFLFAMFAALMSTFAPALAIQDPLLFNLFIVGLVIAVTGLFFILRALAKHAPELTFAQYLFPISLFILAWFFPAREYFQVTPVPVATYIPIIIVLSIHLLLMLILTRVFGDR